MRRFRHDRITDFILLAILGSLISCTTDKTSLMIENSLPRSELEYYSDSFDTMREDLWDRAGYLYREAQVENFKQADLRIEDGRLIIQTQTGSFSKGGLSSRYSLSGDFDVRLNCRMNFIRGIAGMDQVLAIAVLEKSLERGKISSAIIGLSMKEGSSQGVIFSNCIVNGRRKPGGSRKTENFNGSFRFLRIGKAISTFYKNAGAPEWTEMYTFRTTDKDMLIGFQLRNFFLNRISIRANHSISATFDSLEINAAQAIIEEEI